MKLLKEVDFHLHSHYSDGHDEPEDVVRILHQTGVKFAALTDHDTMQGVEEFLYYAQKYGIMAIPGIEVSSHSNRQFEVHLLGFNVNYMLSNAEDLFERNNRERINHTRKVMLKLNESGHLDLTHDQLRRHYEYPGYCVTVLHAMDYLVFQKKYDFQTAREISISTYRSMPRDYSMILSSEEGIAAIKELGGLAFLAHPGELENQIEGTAKEKREILESLIFQMKKSGLKGIEAFHPKHSPETEDEYAALAKKMGLAISAGSDCHGRHKIEQAVGRHGVKVIDMLNIFA